MDVELTNIANITFHSATFLLPSKEPFHDLSNYRAIYHESAACYEVTGRETGQHNYKAITIPYICSLPHVQRLDITMARHVETFHASRPTLELVATTEDYAKEVSSVVAIQVLNSHLVDGEEPYPSNGTDVKRSESSEPNGNAHDKAASSLLTSTGNYIEGVTFTELQHIRYGDRIIASDLEGLATTGAAIAWGKGISIQALDLQLRDINESSLAEWFPDNDLPSLEPFTRLNQMNIEEQVNCTDSHIYIASPGHEVEAAFNPPNLRQYIPDDTSRDVQVALQNSNEDLRNRNEWAQGSVNWFYMCQTSRHLHVSGENTRRPLFADTGRSVNYQTGSGVRTAETSEPETRSLHHYNFEAKPVYCRSSTPPAVSYWVAESPALKCRLNYDGRLHHTVTSSEAAKYVDPYSHHGRQVMEVIGGTALLEKVTGEVEKVYTNHGIWIDDLLGIDDDSPVNGGEAPLCTCYLVPHVNRLPHIPDLFDVGDPIVNDDGRYRPLGKSRAREAVGRP